jgi:hypothetical protein
LRVAVLSVAPLGAASLAQTRAYEIPNTQVPLHATVLVAQTDSGVLKSLLDVRVLANGGLLVNDTLARRLLALTPQLGASVIVSRFGTHGAASYGADATRLLAYRGDTSALIDVALGTVVLFAPTGSLVRTLSLPLSRDARIIAGIRLGTAVFDLSGRLIYAGGRKYPIGEADPWRHQGTQDTTITTRPIGPILRADFANQTVDTIAWLNRERETWLVRRPRYTPVHDPFPFQDEWVVSTDGTVAVVRANDYHIDWTHPSGSTLSTPAIPFAWRRISTAEKLRILDSVRTTLDSIALTLPPPMPGRTTRLPLVDVTLLPDYHPVLRSGHVVADPAGNIWVATARAAGRASGLTYDVITRNGVLTQRVEFPPGRSVAAFGPNGVIYVRALISEADVRLERRTVASGGRR